MIWQEHSRPNVQNLNKEMLKKLHINTKIATLTQTIYILNDKRINLIYGYLFVAGEDSCHKIVKLYLWKLSNNIYHSPIEKQCPCALWMGSSSFNST